MAFKKLVFCLKISSTLPSFVKLAWNSKRYTWSKTDGSPVDAHGNEVVRYSLILQNARRPVYLRTYAGDIQIFYDIFWRSIYQLPLPHFIKAKTIVDLGAHVGMATLFFKLHAPDAIIFALEADEKNFQVLLRNLEPDIKKKQVIPIHAALTNDSETVYLQRTSLSFNTSISLSVTPLVVRGINMEQLLDEYSIGTIDILKIDIEGAESFLFSRECSWLTRVNNILIEIHSDENLQRFSQAALLHHFKMMKLEAEHEDIYWAFRSFS